MKGYAHKVLARDAILAARRHMGLDLQGFVKNVHFE